MRHAKAPSFPYSFLAAVFSRPEKGLDRLVAAFQLGMWLLCHGRYGYQAWHFQAGASSHTAFIVGIFLVFLSLRSAFEKVIVTAETGNRKPDAIFKTIR